MSAPKADRSLPIDPGIEYSADILKDAIILLDKKQITDNVFASGWWLDCAQAHDQQVHEAADCRR